jgi:sugar phosphate isomerase/epimerase
VVESPISAADTIDQALPPVTMSLGLAGGPLPRISDELTSDTARWLMDHGIRAVALHLEDHDVLVEGGAVRVRQTLADHGIHVAQTTGNRPNLVDANPEVRADALARVRRAIAVARLLGATMVNTGVGSHHPSFPYGPHRANHTPQAVETLVANLRHICPEASDAGLLVSLEPQVMTTIGDVETILTVVEAVGHPALRVNFDPVNLLGTLPAVYASAAAIRAIGDRLGSVLAPSAHVKDIRPEPALVLHLEEVPPGEGFIDWAAYFAVCQGLGDGAALIVEHLEGDDVAGALVRVSQMARAHGIAFE